MAMDGFIKPSDADRFPAAATTRIPADLIAAFNDRLEVLTVTEVELPAGEPSHLALLRTDIRPEFRSLLDNWTSDFPQENQLIQRLEDLTRTGELHDNGFELAALMWDEGQYTDHVGSFGVSHLLVDTNHMEELLRRLEVEPVVTDETRSMLAFDLTL